MNETRRKNGDQGFPWDEHEEAFLDKALDLEKIARSLRLHASEMRDRRMIAMQEQQPSATGRRRYDKRNGNQV